jgi:hypothetical protein
MGDDLRHLNIHGRIFQKISIDNRVYCVPAASDELEEDRLAAQHSIIFRLFGDRLFFPGIQVANPRSILDLGYGGGDWCVQCAEEFEDCEVRLEIDMGIAGLQIYWRNLRSNTMLTGKGDRCRPVPNACRRPARKP